MPVDAALAQARALKATKALTLVTRDMRILEVGPSYDPIAPKARGWNVFTVDHAPQDELRRKYSDAPYVDINDIEHVDFVWNGGPISSPIPEACHGTFDACIASHVLEHIPDPITFLADIGKLLRPNGILSIILPDKRFILDCMRPVSTAGAWLNANDQKASRHSRGTFYDCHAYTVTNNGATFWGMAERFGDLNFHSDFAHVISAGDRANAHEYIDAHAWCLTPRHSN